MIGAMPTRAGDIVISHAVASASFYVLWKVIDEGQQESRPEQYASTALGRTAALALARMMARESRGAVFSLDAATSAWTKLAWQPHRRFIASTLQSEH
jgi:hypothetical protein